jgi:GTP-binding protein EngB required for normal cell division
MSEPMQRHQARRDEVIVTLRALREQAERVGATTLANRLDRELCDRLEQDRFHLVVVGEFNQGKSSLVNALLGRALLPVGVTPTTAVIHHVEHAAEPGARLVYADRSEEPLPLSELGLLALGRSQGDDDVAAPHRPAGEPTSEVEAAANGVPRQLSHVAVGFPSELLRERIVLVDTPGVNDLCLQRADVTYQYIPNADAVLFVLDAGQPVKESERVFLRDQLLARSRDKIVFVVAKVDIWSDAERDEALDYVRRELARLVPSPKLFPVAPQLALGGQIGQSGLPELASHLRTFLAQERGRILLDNAIGEGLAATVAVARSIDARRRAARMSSDEIERRIAAIEADLSSHERTIAGRRAAIREETAAVRAWTRRDVARFCDDMVAELGPIIDGEPVEDLRLYLPGFLESCFVRWAEAQGREVAQALEQLAERTVALLREDAHDAAKRLSEAAGDDVPTPDLSVDTFGYDVGVFALFTLGLGMLFTNAIVGGALAIAAPVLAVYLRGRVELETRERAREQADKALREASEKVGPKLDALIESFAGRLEGWVTSAGSEIHRELVDVLAAARRTRSSAAPDVGAAVAACDAQAAELGALRSKLEAMRADLLGEGTSPPAGE